MASEGARELVAYVNGKLVPMSEARVSVTDRSFLYGDGCFEGIQVQGGIIYQLDGHVDRLFASCRYLGIPVPISRAAVREAIIEVVRLNRLADGYLRPLVSRGEGPLGIDRVDELGPPNVVIVPQHRRTREGKALRAKTVSVRRTPPQSMDPRVKSNNYLNSIMGKMEAKASGADVGIMLDLEGCVAEGCGENIFAVRAGGLVTPPPQHTLDGLTRQAVLAIADRERMAAAAQPMTLYDLYTADEVFVTATMTGIAFVTEIDGRPIGDGRPGPLAARLQQLLRVYLDETGVKVL
jgi:branched-chain amino acid aminotransferase